MEYPRKKVTPKYGLPMMTYEPPCEYERVPFMLNKSLFSMINDVNSQRINLELIPDAIIYNKNKPTKEPSAEPTD
ncbi:hypothetical protein PV-S19_0008 [Pacmanvirus S19]|nr:hypothetical protein PV-S19_0008 [Pacmanvirus S19]